MLRSRFWLQKKNFGASVGAICIIFRDLSVPVVALWPFDTVMITGAKFDRIIFHYITVWANPEINNVIPFDIAVISLTETETLEWRFASSSLLWWFVDRN